MKGHYYINKSTAISAAINLVLISSGNLRSKNLGLFRAQGYLSSTDGLSKGGALGVRHPQMVSLHSANPAIFSYHSVNSAIILYQAVAFG